MIVAESDAKLLIVWLDITRTTPPGQQDDGLELEQRVRARSRAQISHHCAAEAELKTTLIIALNTKTVASHEPHL